jgi:hypothetical protein
MQHEYAYCEIANPGKVVLWHIRKRTDGMAALCGRKGVLDLPHVIEHANACDTCAKCWKVYCNAGNAPPVNEPPPDVTK